MGANPAASPTPHPAALRHANCTDWQEQGSQELGTKALVLFQILYNHVTHRPATAQAVRHCGQSGSEGLDSRDRRFRTETYSVYFPGTFLFMCSQEHYMMYHEVHQHSFNKYILKYLKKKQVKTQQRAKTTGQYL